MSDNNIDFSKFVDRIEEIKSSLISYMDEFKARLDDCYDMIHKAPNDDLNRLITAGFVPGARFVFDGKLNLKLVGYTEFLRLDFLDEKEKKHIYVDVDAIAKRIELFKKVEDEK